MEDDKEFMNQYLSTVQGYMKEFMENPKAFEEMLSPIMKMQEKLLLNDNSSNDSNSDNNDSSSQINIAEELKEMKKRILRLERKVLKPKVKTTDDA